MKTITNQIEVYSKNLLPEFVKKQDPVELYDGVLKFGFDEKTGMGLTEDIGGIVRPPDYAGDFSRYPLAIFIGKKISDSL